MSVSVFSAFMLLFKSTLRASGL